ncbi:hypothetical protein TWF481_009892 [Arthrobotrys musiformis]|uniref:Uncharacterized protein n=1 Tax=Arthrobotrys musiformis TaxID=47236 RepID=A0AAV9W740_9PEZI
MELLQEPSKGPPKPSTLSIRRSLPSLRPSAADTTPLNMPYNLSRWASYPRLSSPSPTLAALLKSIRSSRGPVLSGPEIRTTLLTGASPSSVSQQLQSMKISKLAEDALDRKQPQLPIKKSSGTHHLEMSTQGPSDGPISSVSLGSSTETFETANAGDQGSIDAQVQEETKSNNGSQEPTIPTSSDITGKPRIAIPPKALKTDDIGEVGILQAVPHSTNEGPSATSPEVLGTAPATFGSGNSSYCNIGAIFHHKDDEIPPPVPPKPPQYVPAAPHQQPHEQTPQLPVHILVQDTQPDEVVAPTMLIFKVLNTRTNPNNRKCEYHLLYKWSGNSSYFPDCPAVEEIFIFEDFSIHKAVVTRIRVWHSSHIGVSKDLRVEEMKYRLSPAEHTEINRYPWPPFDPRGWYRCLIWGHFGVQPGNE